MKKALELKRASPGLSRQECSRRMGLAKNAVSQYAARSVEFKSVWTLLEAGKPIPEADPNAVPDFLRFRTMHCAYLDRKAKRVYRAQTSNYQRQWITDFESANRLIMVLHPGAGKTTSISEYITRAVMADRNFRSMIIRANADEAAKNVSQIGGRLDHGNYHAWIQAMQDQGDEPITCPVCAYGGQSGFATQSRGAGHRIDEQWRRGALTVSGRTSGDKEATVEAYGAQTPIAGVRSDLIVLDDAQSPQKYRASGQVHTAEMFDWFREDVLGRLYDDQKLVVIGNRLGSQDFVGRLISEYGPEDPDHPGPEDWRVVYYPAILNDKTKRVLVPELWSYDALQRKRREVGEQIWAFQWQQQNVDESDSAFLKEAMDACKDYDRSLGEAPAEATKRYLGVDPAAATGYTAMVVWGVNPESKRRYLIEYLNEKGMRTQDDIAEKAVEMARMHDVDTIVFEVRNIQALIFEKLRTLLRGTGIKLLDYKTATAMGAQAQETDFDITSIAKLMNDRMVSLPYRLNDLVTQRRMDAFVTQFLLWRPKPQGRSSWHLTRDLVMATLFAESEARKAVKRPQTKLGPRPSRLPNWARRQWNSRATVGAP